MIARFLNENLTLLGSTGIRVSPLGLGTVKFGRNTDIKYPDTFDIPDDNTISNLLSLARDLGINLLDTAPAYGSSEERLGRLLRGQRAEWIISTKVGEYYEKGVSTYSFTPQDTIKSVNESLQKLKTDYLDIVLIHSDGKDTYIIEQTGIIETLSRLKEKGIIRAFGLSGKTLEGNMAALSVSDLVMMTYNPAYDEERPVIDKAYETGKGVLIKKAFESGHSINPQESIRFVFSHPGVNSIIIGTINPEHLRMNVKWACEAIYGCRL